MWCAKLLCSALLCLTVVGCRPAPMSVSHRTEDVSTTDSVIDHDLGFVLARAQTIEHAFSIENRTDRPVRLLDVDVLVPCCSRVLAFDDLVEPGASGSVRISCSPGFQTGRKRLGFVVRCDDPSRPRIELGLWMNLVPAWEVRVQDDSDSTLGLRRGGLQRLDVISRRAEGQGTAAPVWVSSGGVISASWLGEAVERDLADGLVETRQTAEIRLPASEEPGPRRATLVFECENGDEREHQVFWDVQPSIVATPEGVVVKPDASKDGRYVVSLVLRSTDTPFRIHTITGTAVGASRTDTTSLADRVQHVELVLDGSRLQPGAASDVRIETDHPDQPVVVVSVLALPPSGGRP